MAKEKMFGYARVSTKDQNEARQVEQFKAIGIDERDIFIDKESGKDFNREKYNALIATIREGDTIFVTSLDRLGRNYREMGEQWNLITKTMGADIVVMDMDILDTRKKGEDITKEFVCDLVFKILSYVADKERKNIKDRQAQGIALAKAAGKYKGRKPIEVDKAEFEKVYGEVVRGERTNRYAMQKLGLKPNTYYRFVNEIKTRTGLWADLGEYEA